MKSVLLVLLLFARTACAGLGAYSSLIVADDSSADAPTRSPVRITYLGVNGYQFETDGHALLVDPYFTRAGFWRVAFNRRIEPDRDRVAEGLKHVRPRVDLVLVTHAHFDHLLDAPVVMQQTGATLLAGPTAANLVQSLGISRNRCRAVSAGNVQTIGPWTIKVLSATHDRVIGSSPPFPGTATQTTAPPVKPSDWLLGEPLAFVIEAAGRRIYIDSGGVPENLPAGVGPIDLAILGVALPDSRKRFAAMVRRIQPRFVLPSHQDDFFAPYKRGFVFGKLTNFPQVLRTYERQRLPGRLILLDYFRPWTLR